MGNRFAPWLALLLASAVAGCTSPSLAPSPPETDAPTSPSAVAPTGTTDPASAAAALDELVATLDRVHPDAWHGIAREDFVALEGG